MKETYQMHCLICQRKFEGASIGEALEKVRSHEAGHPEFRDIEIEDFYDAAID
jgi:hypothetical protein